MDALTEGERREIVEAQLSEYRKRLTPPQMATLLGKTDSVKPLYLLICSEELRFFGLYGFDGSAVQGKVEELPDTVPALFDYVLERVENDMESWARDFSESDRLLLRREGAGDERPGLVGGASLVRDALALLARSRNGLRESEVLQLLAPRGEAELPRVVWSRLYRSLELYLRPQGEDAEGTLDFFHMQLLSAVRSRYLSTRDDALRYDLRLAQFYRGRADREGRGTWRGTSTRDFRDLVFYETRAVRLVHVLSMLGNLRFVQARFSQGVEAAEELLEDYVLARDFLRSVRFADVKEQLQAGRTSRAAVTSWLSEFFVFASQQRAVLSHAPALVFQAAINQPASTAPHAAAITLMRFGLAPPRWIEWVNKPARNKVVSEVVGLTAEATCLSLSADGESALIGFRSGAIKIVNLQTAETVRDFETGAEQGSVRAVALLCDRGRALSAGEDGFACVWDTSTGAVVARAEGHIGELTALAVQPTSVGSSNGGGGGGGGPGGGSSGGAGAQPSAGAAAGSGPLLVFVTASMDSSLRLWEAGQEVRELWTKDWMVSPALCVAFSRDGATLASGTAAGQVTVWDAGSPQLGLVELSVLRVTGPPFAALALAFSASGAQLAVGCDDAVVRVWQRSPDAEAGAFEHCADLCGHGAAVTSLSWSPAEEARLLSASLDKSLRLWDGESRKAVAKFEGHVDAVYSAEFAYEGTCAVSTGLDRTVKVRAAVPPPLFPSSSPFLTLLTPRSIPPLYLARCGTSRPARRTRPSPTPAVSTTAHSSAHRRAAHRRPGRPLLAAPAR